MDARVEPGTIWNLEEVLQRFPAAQASNHGATHSDASLDSTIYCGFEQYGAEFLAALEGRFATVYCDVQRGRLFVARDWIGETPLHYLIGRKKIYFGNTILALKALALDEFSYENVRAFPHCHYQIIDLRLMDRENVSGTFRPVQRNLFYDFEADVNAHELTLENNKAPIDFSRMGSAIKEAVSRRATMNRSGAHSLLLSGGLDSLCVGVALKSLGLSFETFTITVDQKLGEAEMASTFSKKLGVKHYIIDLKTEEILRHYEEAVRVSETYAIYNVYCAVGMLLMGRKLRDLNVERAFCGEGMNEAVGDYKDWSIYNPIMRQSVLMQQIDRERIEKSSERLLYVWGHSSDKGKYNRQQGTGLAKHAASRMVKPFLASGLQLECPYYDRELLSSIVALQPDMLRKLGGKPGLFWNVFREEFEKFGFNEEFIGKCKKIRLQDATDAGSHGISSVLIASGHDQERTLTIFNSIFGSKFNAKEKSKQLLCTQ